MYAKRTHVNLVTRTSIPHRASSILLPPPPARRSGHWPPYHPQPQKRLPGCYIPRPGPEVSTTSRDGTCAWVPTPSGRVPILFICITSRLYSVAAVSVSRLIIGLVSRVCGGVRGPGLKSGIGVGERLTRPGGWFVRKLTSPAGIARDWAPSKRFFLGSRFSCP